MFALTLDACGTDDPRGGEARLLVSAFPDHLDPQLAYSAEGWAAVYNVYVPLLTYRHAPGVAGTEVIPGLAEDLPKISHGGRRYELRLREGLEYSDGGPVRASDFERAVERLFTLDSPGAPFFGDIVGAAEYREGEAAEIAGIETDDASGRIAIELRRPRGTLANELALSYAVPVPAKTPVSREARAPIPTAGPYEIAEVSSGREYRLVRNPAWQNNAGLLPQLPGGELDEITVTVEKNLSSQTTMVERNRADSMLDAPPSDRLAEIEAELGDRFRVESTPSTYFFWMNTRRPPFDDVDVRRAVNYAIDPEAVAKIYGGLMAPTQQILPPEVPGYESLALYPHDPARARRLVAKASPADTEVTVWTVGQDPNDRAGLYYQGILEELGFETELKTLGSSIYFDTIGNRGTPELDTGWSNWFASYPHPNDFFDSLLDGASISATHNNNNSLFDDPGVNREIDELARRPLTSGSERRYAALDREVMREAPLAPYGNYQRTTFVSERIDFDRVYLHPVFTHDYTSFAIDD